MEKYFNFNNEEYVLTIDEAEDGKVTFDANGQKMEFDSVLDLAHNYAIARNVTAANLKNWTLVQDGHYYSFVLRAATAGADFFENRVVENEVYNESYDEEEYDDEFDDKFEEPILNIGWLTYEERQVLEFLCGTSDDETLADQIYDNHELYEELKSKVQTYTDFARGNFDLGFGIAKLIFSINNGRIPESEVENANKQLTMAQIARRDSIQVYVVNMTTGGAGFGQRRVTAPFRNTELVVNVAKTFVIFEK